MGVNKININNNDSNYAHSIFDISEYTGKTYDTLSDALADIPDGKKKGGMTVSFVSTSDNKYVQFRLMSNSFNTTVANWQGVDDEPTTGSDNLVKSGGVAGEIGEIDKVLNGSYISVDKTPVTGDLIVYEGLESGHKYTINIVDMDASGVAGTTAVLFLRIHRSTGDAVIGSIQGQNTHYENYVWEIEIPTNAEYAWITGKNNIHVSLIIKDDADKEGLVKDVEKMSEDIDLLNVSVQQNTEDVETLNNDIIHIIIDMYDQEINVEETEAFLNNGEFVHTATEHDGYCFRVKRGQRVIIIHAINNPQCKCAFCLDKPAIGTSVRFMENSPITYRYDVDYVCPSDGWCYFAKMYIIVEDGATLYSSVTVDGISVFDGIPVRGIKSKVNEMWEREPDVQTQNQSDAFDFESKWWAFNKSLDFIYGDAEETNVNNFIATVQTRAGAGKYQIAVISDTHGTGAYSNRSNTSQEAYTCFRSISIFNRIAPICDAALHGGDISCDYGTSRNRILQYMLEVMQMFRFDKPFFITKGNHDVNYDIYIEADMHNLDWVNVEYYKRYFSQFTRVTTVDDWRGEQLYIVNQQKVSDNDFGRMQHWLCPTGANWGNGAYYYYDIDSVKIRFIVGNSFPITADYGSGDDDEYLWLAQTALNFSAKPTPSDWSVIMLRHTQSTGIQELSDCINAFRLGSTWSYKGTTVDFGSVNGGAMTFIAHIHGHEHRNDFSNGEGYIDIGENASFVNLDELGDAKKYGLSVLTVDTNTSKIYEDFITGQALCYNYANGKIEVTVNNGFGVAMSGLNDATITSSDSSILEIVNRSAIARSVGDAIVTIAGTNSEGVADSYQYSVSVVDSY